jgi:hypothetical protein
VKRADAHLRTFWPLALRHLARPLSSATDEDVVVAEVSSDPVDGFVGERLLFTALVPLDKVDAVLRNRGGVGHRVRSWGPGPIVPPEGGYSGEFWIDGRNRGSEKFETITHSWVNHNKVVLSPDDAFLMCYGLVPRVIDTGIIWDDPGRPVYDVVRVVPLSHYSIDHGYTKARIAIKRDYLQDYMSLKGCAAVATFYEERYSKADPQFDRVLGTKSAKQLKLPGRELWLKRVDFPHGGQLSQVWGCALLLKPRARPISNPDQHVLRWPDRKKAIKGTDRGEFGPELENVYVRDEVLTAYEASDFDISPESGGVSNNGWWAVSYCDRYSRNIIRLELRKLYESATPDVIKRFNAFAVSRRTAELDRRTSGIRHIGVRAGDVIYSFLSLTSSVAEFSQKIGDPYSQQEIGQLTTSHVKYQGWWRISQLRSLGNVVPMTLTRQAFLARCGDLYKLFENLEPAPLRRLLKQLGIDTAEIADFGRVRLLDGIFQFCIIARTQGFDTRSETLEISKHWKPTERVPQLRRLHALHALRVADAHLMNNSATRKFAEALTAFNIDSKETQSGWGSALDSVYDGISSMFQDTAEFLRRC